MTTRFRTVTIYDPDNADRTIVIDLVTIDADGLPTHYEVTLDSDGRGTVSLPCGYRYGIRRPNSLTYADLIYSVASISLWEWAGVGAQDNQIYDATLETIAALATDADKMIYFTAEDAAALADLTAFMRTLLDDADAATARATLGAAAAADIPDELTDLDTAVTGAELDADHSKLAGIESNATADQTAGEIEAIVNHDNLVGFAANEHVALPNTIANVLSDAGTMAAQDASSVLITGGSMGNVTLVNVGIVSLSSDLAIAHGGTGASTAAAARTNLGAAAAADIPDELTDLDTAVTGTELDDIAANVADIVRESDGKLQINGGTTHSLIRLVNSSSGSSSSDGGGIELYSSTLYVANKEGDVSIDPSDDDGARFDNNSTAGNTRMLLYDVDTGACVRVSVGADDSGGSGYKVLRIPN